VSGRSPIPYSELGPGFWNGDFGSTPGGKYARPGAGFGPGRSTSLQPKGSQNDPIFVKAADMPTLDVSPMSLTTFGGRGFAIPGGGGGGGRTSYGGAARARDGGGFGNPYTNPASSGTGALTGLITDKANEMAKKYNVDATWLSDTMEGIRAGESRHDKFYDKKDDALESSWGPFQLNRRRGLGVQFEKDTGLDVRDSSTIPAQAA
jgi:hypothetical protein